MKANEHDAKSPSTRTGRFTALVRLPGGSGSGAPSHRRLLVALLGIAALALLIAPAAQAGKVPGFGVLGTGASGTGAGQLGNQPRGVAVNATGAGGVPAGEVYVSDATNNRIAEYHGGGEFVRVFGQNVVASGPDNVTPASAVQTIEVPNTVTAGTFVLGFNGANTGGTATGTLTEGSNAVTGLITAKGTGNLKAGSFTVSGVATSVGRFLVGQPVTGVGIPAGTKVTAVNGSTLTLSAAPTAEGTGVELTSSGPLPFTVGEAVSGSGIPAGTTIAATGAGTLTLSAPVEAGQSGSGVALTANLPYNATAATVQTALLALGTVGTGNLTATGGPGAAAPYVVTFAGALKEAPMPLVVPNSSGLTGGSVAVATTTPGVSPNEVCNVVTNPSDVCQKGTSNSTPGAIAEAAGIAVDPATGNVFVISNASERVNVYSATGSFEGAFGWKVNASAPAEEVQFCTYATGCAAAPRGAGAGQFGELQSLEGSIQPSTPAISPVNGHILVPDPTNRRVDEFSLALNGSKEVIGASFLKAFGGDVVPAIDEKQVVALTGATGGRFALEYGPQSTDASGSGEIVSGSEEILGVHAATGAFARGEEISGPGIPAGTRISVVTFDSITMTAPATQTAAGATISAALPFNAEARVVEGALQALPGIGSGNVGVTGTAGGPWTIEFEGSLGGVNVPQLIGNGSSLTGSSPSVGLTTIQTGSNGSGTGFETCTVATTCKVGAGDGQNGSFAPGKPQVVAIDSTGAMYVAGRSGETCGSSCGLQKFNVEGLQPQEFAPAQLSAIPAASTTATTVLLVTIDPSNDHVLVVKKTSQITYRLYEFTRTGTFIDSSPPGEAGFQGAGAGPKGIAVGTAGRAYVAVVGTVKAGVPVRIFNNPPSPQASIEPASGVSGSTATLNGVAKPSAAGLEGGFPTVAYFEYSTNGVSWTATKPIEIGVGGGSGSPNSCPTNNPPSCNLSQTITGLAAGQPYLVRLVVSNGTAATSATTGFETTQATPSVSAMGSSGVSQGAATLEGQINPNNRSTTYHFEWGLDSSYGNRVPAEFDAVAGSGGQPVGVSANLAGLEPNTTYHFRIVAKSSAGPSVGPDSEFTTLNSAGLPDNRAAELVSPADKKPAGSVRPFLPDQLLFETAEDGEHIAYPILNGTDESTAGGEVIVNSDRTPQKWLTGQLTPPSLIPIQRGGVLYVDRRDFKCALIESRAPLTSNTPQIDVENAVINLYRWSASDDSYTLITNRVPLNPGARTGTAHTYEIAGASSNCSKIIFRVPTLFFAPNYEFLANSSGLYEWDNGVLRDAGLRPDGTPPVAGTAGEEAPWSEWSVSPEGRFFFSAASDAGTDNGKRAVFVRKGPTQVVDASLSKTATSTLGASYETASPDGSHVFFLANYGLTAVSSSGPAEDCTQITNLEQLNNIACDLYDYNVETGELTDISADANPADSKGAVAQGIVDVSKDGSTVYFSARGQLVPGQGSSYAQNLQGAGQASLYRWHEGRLTYVGQLSAKDVEANSTQGSLIRYPWHSAAQTDDQGRFLLFVSRVNMLGNNPQELPQAYFYSAAEESLTCVSCLPAGQAPRTYAEEPVAEVVTTQGTGASKAYSYRPRSLSDDGQVFFNSLEALAPGAVAGQANVYEWYRGQLSLLTTGRLGMYGKTLLTKFVGFGGPHARDAFVVSLERLAPQDTDLATDVYDLRSGGGFPAPPPAPPGCEPALGQCQGPGAAAPAPPQPATAGFQGAGNPPNQGPAKPKKHQKKKHQKKNKNHKKKAKHSKSGKAGRAAGVDHGGAK